MKLMDSINKLNINKLLLYSSLSISIIIAIVLTFVYKLDWFNLLVCISGVLYLALLADRNFINFLIGIINVTIYVVVAYKFKLFGEVIFYCFFDLPMAFISYFLWRKHKDTKLTVKSRSLKLSTWLIIVGVCSISVFAYGLFLKFIGGENVFIDALSTVVSTVATLLMAFRYKEQWFMWIVVYVVSIIMWCFAFDVLMIIMSVECTIISILGYVEWKINTKKQQLNLATENKD